MLLLTAEKGSAGQLVCIAWSLYLYVDRDKLTQCWQHFSSICSMAISYAAMPVLPYAVSGWEGFVSFLKTIKAAPYVAMSQLHSWILPCQDSCQQRARAWQFEHRLSDRTAQLRDQSHMPCSARMHDAWCAHESTLLDRLPWMTPLLAGTAAVVPAALPTLVRWRHCMHQCNAAAT